MGVFGVVMFWRVEAGGAAAPEGVVPDVVARSESSVATVMGEGAEEIDGEGSVVINFIISVLRRCHDWIMLRYSSNGLFDLEGLVGIVSMPVIIFSSADSRSFEFFSRRAGHVLTRHSGSLLKYSCRKPPISETSLLSAPSTAITTPRTCCIGLVGPGSASGGEIFDSTLILLIYGIVMTMASTLRSWLSAQLPPAGRPCVDPS